MSASQPPHDPVSRMITIGYVVCVLLTLAAVGARLF
jgi:hypothetical protein